MLLISSMAPALIIVSVLIFFGMPTQVEMVSVPCQCMDSMENKSISGSSGETTERFHICYSESKPFGQVFDREQSLCYNLLEQGSCVDGMLLALSMKNANSVTCLPTCDKETETKDEWHSKLRNGECALAHDEMIDLLQFYFEE